MALQHLRSSTANKRPLPAGMSDGQLAINTNLASPGVFFKDSNGDLVKAGPVHVGATAPNSSPASGGQTGNTKGELWLDTSTSPNQLKTWDGSAWISDFPDEIPVSKLQDGTARQLLQTDAAGTGVEWASNIDIPGTLDVTSAATFDSTIGASAGSASTPSITFTGDLNTGIYSPGADQVAISTGGSGRLFINSSGQVGVGVSPSASLEVNGEARFTRSGVASQYVGITGDGTDTRIVAEGASKNLTIKNNSTTSSAIIFDQAVASSYIFNQAGNERLRIDSSGRVGIGTSSVGSILHLNGSSPVLKIDSSNLNASSTIQFNGKNSNGEQQSKVELVQGVTETGGGIGATFNILTTKESGSGGVFTSSLYINELGRVGIGTTPETTLDVNGAITLRPVSIPGTGKARIYERDTDSKLYIQTGTGNAIRFLNSSQTDLLNIDSSGRLLVGTSSSPSAGTGQYALAVVQGYAGGATGEGILSIARGKVATSMVNTDTVGQIAFTDNAGNTFARIVSSVDGTVSSTSDLPGSLSFSTTADGASSPTERMRISSTGFISINGDTDTGFSQPAANEIAVTVGGTERTRVSYTGKLNLFAASNDNVLGIQSAAAAGTSLYAFYASYGSTSSTDPGTQSFAVFTNGNVVNTNNSYGAISDIKLKENVVDANSQWDDLKALQVRNYNFKEGQTHTQIGLVAQEVELVSPGLVSESPDRDEDGNDLGTVTKSVNYSVLYMKAVKALQEAMERIEVLEQRLNDAGIN